MNHRHRVLRSCCSFDKVEGDNLPTAQAKVPHVLASANNVLAAFGEELGPYAERTLRQRVENARFFVRARIIGDEIYQPAAPVPDTTPSPDRNQFLREIVEQVEQAAKGIKAELV